MTKIDIISGFLGAGKTTLIKKLIQEAFQGQKVVLIENEFGEIGIDGGFLKESGIQINEMNSGCICCSLVGDFKTALQDVLKQYEPDRIIIEPSGVGKLSDVIKAVQKVVDGEKVLLNSYITVADAQRAKMYLKNFGEFYNNQVEFASAIILSRTQKVTEKKLEQVVELIREINDKSPIVTTPWDELTGRQILDVMEGKNDFEEELLAAAAAAPTHEHHHHHEHGHHHGHHHDHCHHGHDHDADEVFTSWGRETPKKFSESTVKEILKKLADEDSTEYGIILRAKGIVQDEEGKWLHFDLVPGEEEVRYGAADYTGRICVIGSDLKEDKLAELFGL